MVVIGLKRSNCPCLWWPVRSSLPVSWERVEIAVAAGCKLNDDHRFGAPPETATVAAIIERGAIADTDRQPLV